ncbi:hypothetical protein ABIA39_004079 [Nocardia sp. GAS34]|uniref:DUF6924 domain-containing protein n=1 Tax=unclassified Nocardia TaxID=2637762 RepID=UPI003D213F25
MIIQRETQMSLVVRTDFSDQQAWEACRSAIEKSAVEAIGHPDNFVEFVDSPEYRDITVQQFLDELPEGDEDENDTYVMLADQQTMTNADHPVLVLDLFDAGRGTTARVASSELWEVVGNLDNANMDVRDYADAAGEDGVFRNFP